MSGWIGPNWGMWADTVDEMNATAKRADKNYQSAVEWKEYAKRLEVRLEETWQAFREDSGNASGQHAVRQAAIEEIARIDPTNKMLNKEYRLNIFDKAKEERLKEIDSSK